MPRRDGDELSQEAKVRPRTVRKANDAWLEWLRVGPDDQPLPDDRLVFLRQNGETVKSFRTAWERHARKPACPRSVSTTFEANMLRDSSNAVSP